MCTVVSVSAARLRLTAVDLFCGAGGLSRGLQDAGFSDTASEPQEGVSEATSQGAKIRVAGRSI